MASVNAATIDLTTASDGLLNTDLVVTNSTTAVDGIIATLTAGGPTDAYLIGNNANAVGVWTDQGALANDTDWRLTTNESITMTINQTVTIDSFGTLSGWNGSDFISITSSAFDNLTGYTTGGFSYVDGVGEGTITYDRANGGTPNTGMVFGQGGNSVLTLTAGTDVVITGNGASVRDLNVTAVPEPSSSALLGLGGLALILRRRK